MDLSTGFVPRIDPFGGGGPTPVPPPPSDAAVKVLSSTPVSDSGYQGVALSNDTDNPMTVRVEARSLEGKIAAGEGLINPAFLTLPPRAQSVFLAEDWLGPGVRRFNGSFQTAWSQTRTSSLGFRGSNSPTALEGIGPLPAPSVELWLPLVPEHQASAPRRIRIFSAGNATNVEIIFRNRLGNTVQTRQETIAALGTLEVAAPSGSGDSEPASAQIRSAEPVSARLEASGPSDSWSLDAHAVTSSNRYIQPHVEWNGIFQTRFIFLNPSAQDCSVMLQLRSDDGMSVGPAVPLDINRFWTQTVTVEQLFGIQTPRGAGWVEANVSGGPVLIAALAIDPNTGAAAGSFLESSQPALWSMPYFVENSGYFTGLALANPGDSTASAVLTAYDSAGAVLGRANLTLSARQAQTQLISQWISGLGPTSSGHITISSSPAVIPLAYFGTTDGASLAAIPLQPVDR
jgi:hypothetical protein